MAKTRKNTSPAKPSESFSQKAHQSDGISASHVLILAAFIGLLAVLLYLNTMKNDFIEWDDPAYVLTNLRIQSLDVSFFKWAFFSFHSANWHPITWISHAVDYALWGLKPSGHHLTNVLLHGVNTALVVLVGTKLLEAASNGRNDGQPAPNRKILVAAGVAGILFGIHPVHVESVAWVAERKDLLCGMFFLLSLLAYSVRARRPRWKTDRLYALSLVMFILALMSKPMAVSLPLVLLILDWYPFRRFSSGAAVRPVFIEKIPFFALSIASSVVTVLAQKAEGTMGLTVRVPLYERLLVAVKSVVMYLLHMTIPVRLFPYYPYPQPGEISMISPQFLLPLIVSAGGIYVLIRYRQRNCAPLAVAAYFLVTLLPVLGIVQVGGQAMADRYSYLPSVGPFLAAGAIGAHAWGKAEANPALRGSAVAGAILVLALLSFLSLKQMSIWKNSIDFWTYVISHEPKRIPLAYNNRGIAFEDRGEYDRAIQDFSTAIMLQPGYAEAYVSRGATRYRKQDYNEAVQDYTSALQFNPSGDTLYNLYLNRGASLRLLEQYDAALKDYEAAISLQPGTIWAYINRAVLYEHIAQPEKAIQDYDRILALEPSYVAAYMTRGNLLSKMGRAELAAADFRTACGMGSRKACEKLAGTGR